VSFNVFGLVGPGVDEHDVVRHGNGDVLLHKGHVDDVVKGLKSGFGCRCHRCRRLLGGAPGQGADEKKDGERRGNHSIVTLFAPLGSLRVPELVARVV
jgi:hypothetical protein